MCANEWFRYLPEFVYIYLCMSTALRKAGDLGMGGSWRWGRLFLSLSCCGLIW